MADPRWFESDALWEAMLPALDAPARARVAEDDVRALSGLLGLSGRERVLDVGCGAGVHAVALARRGHRVIGLDRTAALLFAAQARARAERVDVSWLLSDMRTFELEGPVDLAVCLQATFGYLPRLEDDLAVLRRLRGALAPGGRLVLDVLGKELAGATFYPRAWVSYGDTTLLEDRTVLAGWEFQEPRWAVLRGGARSEHVTRQRLYSGTELSRLLAEAGFAGVELFGGFDVRPYDRAAQRLVAVGRRD